MERNENCNLSLKQRECLSLLYQDLGVDPEHKDAKGQMCLIMLNDHFGFNWKHQDAEQAIGKFGGIYRACGTAHWADDRKIQVLRFIGRTEFGIDSQTPEDEDRILIQMMYHFLKVDPQSSDADELSFTALTEHTRGNR